jgi:hypothetical protein
VGDGILLVEETAKLFGRTVQVNIFKTYGTAQIKFDETEIEFRCKKEKLLMPIAAIHLLRPARCRMTNCAETANAPEISLNEMILV